MRRRRPRRSRRSGGGARAGPSDGETAGTRAGRQASEGQGAVRVMLCTSTWWCTLLRVLGWQTCALGSHVARPLLGAALRSEPTQRPITRRGARWSRGAKLATPAAGARVARAVRGSALLLASRNQNVIRSPRQKITSDLAPCPTSDWFDWFGFGGGNHADDRGAGTLRGRPRVRTGLVPVSSRCRSIVRSLGCRRACRGV